MKGPMGEILSAVQETEGPEVSNLLAKNPDALMQMAVGRAYLLEMNNQTQQKQLGNQNQQKAVQFAKGSARPTNSQRGQNRSYDTMSDDELERLAFEELARQQN